MSFAGPPRARFFETYPPPRRKIWNFSSPQEFSWCALSSRRTGHRHEANLDDHLVIIDDY